MQKALLATLLIFASSVFMQAQIQIDWLDILDEEVDRNTNEIFAVNKGHCPLTVIFDFATLKNFKSSKKLPIEIVIPNDGKKHLVTTLKLVNPRKEAGYNFKLNYIMGDINSKHDDSQVYLLPYPNGKEYYIGQAYNGRFSHKHLNAIDFEMKEGSKVCAARGGTVVSIKEDSNTGCRNNKCKDKANYILIHHKDGSFASYVHLKKNGALVSAGDRVKAGQVIGLSGNTGWSSGPHLHFEVYTRKANNVKYSVPTKFLVDKDQIETLHDKSKYTAWHP